MCMTCNCGHISQRVGSHASEPTADAKATSESQQLVQHFEYNTGDNAGVSYEAPRHWSVVYDYPRQIHARGATRERLHSAGKRDEADALTHTALKSAEAVGLWILLILALQSILLPMMCTPRPRTLDTVRDHGMGIAPPIPTDALATTRHVLETSPGDGGLAPTPH
ncbi:unnamed protein product [Ostreobium quekettii]|uniref:Uncharacterized protein n=1 Tax=Ostreobium quekettii TaxID=121088 RepID=A0A8S1IQH1_9CHLO|nr:unnamed protein product [Ostreobium quekettii]